MYMDYQTTLLPVMIAVPAMITAWAITRTVQTSKERTRRLDMIEQALKRGDLDPQLRRELIQALKPERSGIGKLFFALGWLGIFVFGTMLALDPPRHDFFVALFGLVTSFGVVTLPLAVREVEARRST